MIYYQNSTPTKEELKAELERIKYQLRTTEFNTFGAYAFLSKLYIETYNDLLTLEKYEN